MCRSIKQLRGAEPEATQEEIAAAALQYVRKVTGFRTPSCANREAFDRAVAEIAATTSRVLEELTAQGPKIAGKSEGTAGTVTPAAVA